MSAARGVSPQSAVAFAIAGASTLSSRAVTTPSQAGLHVLPVEALTTAPRATESTPIHCNTVYPTTYRKLPKMHDLPGRRYTASGRAPGNNSGPKPRWAVFRLGFGVTGRTEIAKRSCSRSPTITLAFCEKCPIEKVRAGLPRKSAAPPAHAFRATTRVTLRTAAHPRDRDSAIENE